MQIGDESMIRVVCLAILFGLSACGSGPPQTPYPAFVQADELPDIFIAGMPGVRAQQLAGNPSTRRTSNRIQLPEGWNFTTGASPGKSVEIFVLAGEVQVGPLLMGSGGYAYVPPGSNGMQLATRDGAVLMYFLDDANDSAVIQTPLLMDSNLLKWTPVSEDPNELGRSVKVLRADPGSGARTWLEKIDPIATLPWQQSSVTREGYLVSGTYRDGECVDGEALAGDYLPGGYFHRTPGAVSGGPEAGTATSAVWFMRVLEKEALQEYPECVVLQVAE